MYNMGKKTKDHRKKVNSRNQKIVDNKINKDKEQTNFLRDLIEQERKKGMFDKPLVDSLDSEVELEAKGPTL